MSEGKIFLNKCKSAEVQSHPWPHQVIENTLSEDVFLKLKTQCEEKITSKGVTLFIDPAAVMFLVGSQMDWNESKFSSGFDFKNPNEIARCGCGESFSVSS